MPIAMVVSIQPIAFGSRLKGRTRNFSINAPTTAHTAIDTSAAISSGAPSPISTTASTAPSM